MRRLCCRPFHPHLESALVEDLRAARGLNPSAPHWVLVPSRNLRQRLRRRLADEGVPTFNVRCVLFPELAEVVLAAAGPGPPGPPPRLIDSVADALIVQGIVAGLPNGGDGYFGPVASSAGFHRALLRTLRDLDEAGVDPASLARLARKAPAGVNAPKLAELAGLAEARLARLRERGAETQAQRIGRAAGCALRLPVSEPLSVYGFYDLAGVQRRLLAGLFPGRRVDVYLPLVGGAGDAYAAPLREWLAARGFPEADDGAYDLPAPEVDWFSAAGEQREAEECVRRILALLGRGEVAPDRIAVLYRTADPCAGLLRRAFERAGIPAIHAAAPSLAETRPARALRLLIDAALSGLGRREILDFFDSVTPDLPRIEAADRVALVAAWDGLTREAGIVRGRAQWDARLLRRRGESGRDPQKGEAREILRRELPALFAFIDDLARERSWSGLADRLARGLPDWLPPGPARDALLQAVARLADLDLTGEPAGLLRLADALDEILGRTAFGAPPPAQAAVFVGDVMRARGLSFDRVFLLGVAEGVFPGSAGQDPILLDVERRHLADDAEWLPLKRSALDEESLLFELVTGAAPALTLSWPRIDPATGRPRLPSSFLLRAAARKSGRPADYAALDRLGARIPLDLLEEARLAGARDPEQAVPVSPGRHLDAWRSIDQVEFDRLLTAAAVGAGKMERLAALRGEPAFRRALDAEEARGRPVFTRYDGVIETEAGRAALNRLLPEGRRLSASRLEKYADCPFRYFLDSLLGIEEDEAPEDLSAIPPMDRGTLVHGILRDFLADPAVIPLRAARRQELHEALAAISRDRFRDYEKDGVVGHPLVWAVEQRRLLDDLAAWLDFEIDRGDDFVPVALEAPFGMEPAPSRPGEDGPAGEPVRLTLPGGGEVRFRGRIDRVDADPSGAARVVDYKTGRPPENLEVLDLNGGRRLQLPVYLLAVERLFGKLRPAAGEYLHLRGGPFPETISGEVYRALLPELARVTEVLLTGIEAGLFFARPDPETCKYCAHLSVCGVDREPRFARKQGDPRVRAHLGLDEEGAPS